MENGFQPIVIIDNDIYQIQIKTNQKVWFRFSKRAAGGNWSQRF